MVSTEARVRGGTGETIGVKRVSFNFCMGLLGPEVKQTDSVRAVPALHLPGCPDYPEPLLTSYEYTKTYSPDFSYEDHFVGVGKNNTTYGK